jgi:alpha-tubulin suppressor-like RCC1 family protein
MKSFFSRFTKPRSRKESLSPVKTVMHYKSTDNSHIYACGINDNFQCGSKEPQVVSTLQKMELPPHGGIKIVSCGRGNVCIVTNEDQVFLCGNNIFENTTIDKVEKIDTNKLRGQKIIAVSCGGYHCLLLTEELELFAYGKNDYGQLCIDNTAESVFEFIPVKFDHKIAQIETGATHSVILTTQGQVYMCGYNGYGQLCTGDYQSHKELTLCNLNFSVARVAAGSLHTMFVTTKRTCLGVGYNIYGQLGDSTQNTTTSPVQMVLPRDVYITDVFCGSIHTIALASKR